MSSMTLCLFSVALCNIGNVDQSIFGQQQQPQSQQVGFGQNIFNGFVNAAGLGNTQFNQQQQPNQNANKNKPRQPHASPCKARFQYVTNGQEWKGVIKFRSFDVSINNHIDADFALPPQQRHRNPNHRYGRMELVNDPGSIANDLENGLPILFETIFNYQNPVPKLVAIYKNNKQICVDQNLDTQQYTTFRLHYRLPAIDESEDRFTIDGPAINPQPRPPQNPQQRPPQNPQQNQKPPTQAPQQRPPQNPQNQNFDNINQFQDDNTVCGVPVVLTQSLVVGGQPVQNHGEWPWLVAFYKSVEGNLQFICGGSLLNARYVLTAAHCIQDKGRTEAQREQDALLFIGKHNLIQWNEEGYEKRGALKFKVHPDWKPAEQSYDGDIALIQMDKPVKYSKFIRPICLWNGAPEITKVVGQVGIVAGWGKNEDGKLNTDFPKKVNVPIVSDGTCLRANEAFVYITSDRTFCAGGRNGEGPCQGDSGGGLVLKVGKKWFVRGIVSASLRDGVGCDVNSYAIFTDVAQYRDWIRSEM